MGIMQRWRQSICAGMARYGRLTAIFILALPAAAQSELPDGPGKALVERICSGCHGFTAITDNRATRDHWEAVVENMVSRGAQATDEELDRVVDYLAKNFG